MSRGARWRPRFVPEQFDSASGVRRALSRAHSRGDVEAVKRLTKAAFQSELLLRGGATRKEIAEGEPFDDDIEHIGRP
jgi:hypothetical protein